MVYDDEYDPASYDGQEANGKGHGEAWERLNNLVLAEWNGFKKRLEEYAERREQDGRPLTAAERAAHITRFRDKLMETYGTSAVDARWEAERAKRLDARNQVQSPYRKGGGYAA